MSLRLWYAIDCWQFTFLTTPVSVSVSIIF